jgi:molybdenum cofactor cytidylyltransferase
MTEARPEHRLEAIVLAAGAGSRFGGGKLLAPWAGGVLLEGALATAFAAPVRGVSVVWGVDAQAPEAARRFAERVGAADRLRLVHAVRAAEGMAESLKAGIASLSADCMGAFVFLGDMPRVPATAPAALAQALAAGASGGAPPVGGRPRPAGDV